MNFLPRRKLYFGVSVAIFVMHLGVAAFAKPSFRLTLIGDAFPCALLIISLLAVGENFRKGSGLLPLFWKLVAAGLMMMLLSQIYWFYYDSLRQFSAPSPAPGDTIFLLAHIFFLSTLALRPHSALAGRDLRIRRLDFALLTLWWFSLYGYFSWPWQAVVVDFSKYNPAYYLLALIQHLVLIGALAVLAYRNDGAWRRLYLHLMVVFCLIATGNLLLSVLIDRGIYYAGGFFDTPFLLSIVWFTYVAELGPSLQPHVDSRPNRELKQSLWTARVAMLAVLSLPLIAFIGYYEKGIPSSVVTFRLRLVFAAMFLIGTLAFWKLNLLSRELVRLVNLTHTSVEDLKLVQNRITQSQKLAALGRLAAGATHEVSNPLTAILGYSELLADIPSLSAKDRWCAEEIQVQVHRAQTAVISLRNTLRAPASEHPGEDGKDSSR
jgi:His Kinase A (phospho-acceptor) domain